MKVRLTVDVGEAFLDNKKRRVVVCTVFSVEVKS